MSDVAAISTAKPQKVSLNQTVIQGKVLRINRHEKLYYTQIICAAPDLYSKPSIVEVRSKTRLGDLEDLVTVTCLIGGYSGRSYNTQDKATGDMKTVYPVNITLDLVET